MRRLVFALVFTATLALAQQPNAELHKLFRDYYEEGLREFPEAGTRVGRREFDDRWSDTSPAGMEASRKTAQSFLNRLEPFRKANLNEQDRLSLEILDWQLKRSIENIDTIGPYNAVNHFFGRHLAAMSTLAIQDAKTVKDYENLITRLNGLPKYMDGLIASANLAISRKTTQPKLVVEQTIRQLEAQAAPEASASPLLAQFRKFPASIPAAEQDRLRKAAEQAYTNSFRPAWNKYRDYLRTTYLPQSRDSIGISEVFNGRERYSFLVRQSTTTNLTAKQIHDIGLREVDRIKSEMAAIRSELKFTGSSEEFAEKVLMAPEMRFKSEAEILVHGREIAKRLDPELPRLFKVLPRMPYGVKAIPADRARTAAPYYEQPALDGSRAGNFFLRTVEPETQSKCCMEALIIHEAVPGHHLQIALAQEMENVPEFRRVAGFTAYIEGWGLYAETLGPELNMYQTPYERYGKLQSEMMRAVRLVVDTGVHSLGWTRDQAIQLMRLAKGGFVNEAMVISEIDRYIAIPGQALAYKMGALKIQELRARAEKELGAKFDIREFHHAVLKNGALPLEILERQIDRYIADAKRS
jgi:uncharacterized protein (DUF885 family)